MRERFTQLKFRALVEDLERPLAFHSRVRTTTTQTSTCWGRRIATAERVGLRHDGD